MRSAEKSRSRRAAADVPPSAAAGTRPMSSLSRTSTPCRSASLAHGVERLRHRRLAVVGEVHRHLHEAAVRARRPCACTAGSPPLLVSHRRRDRLGDVEAVGRQVHVEGDERRAWRRPTWRPPSDAAATVRSRASHPGGPSWRRALRTRRGGCLRGAAGRASWRRLLVQVDGHAEPVADGPPDLARERRRSRPSSRPRAARTGRHRPRRCAGARRDASADRWRRSRARPAPVPPSRRPRHLPRR